MSGALRVVLGDQCTRTLAGLRDLDPAADTVLLAEVEAECTYVPHHKQKIALVLSAMRHFARALEARGVRVRHVRLDEPGNTGTLRGEVLRAARALAPGRIVCTHPGEWRVLEDMLGWEKGAGVPVLILDDDRFLCSLARFREWADGEPTLRMEGFYRAMRREHGLLLDARGEPEGGRWNHDRDNRAPPRGAVRGPAGPDFPPDAVTREVIALVARRFPGHFGALDAFNWPVTARDAARALADFVQHRLPGFGAHQDVMLRGERTLFHARVSASLNAGLLDPMGACRAAEAAFRDGRAPINAAEGFVRQILGWREYVRGAYWMQGPEYRALNALGATRPLPGFFWSGETRMSCVRHVVAQCRDLAYAHHIQRLMVTGNFALLAGLAPAAVDEWYMVVFADAYEWVELPNVHGMALHADGGLIGSKPYAASGAYIDRMSDYCGTCFYDPRDGAGPRGCPFNALFWDFVARHAERFRANPRMEPVVRNAERLPPERLAALRARAASVLGAVEAGGGDL